MIAAGVLVDSGSPAEFAHHADKSRVEHAALFEVSQQHRQAGVQVRQQVVFENREIVVVRVPVCVVDRHAADSGFDKASCHQARLAKRVATVLVTNGCRFRLNVEGDFCRGRRDQVERFFLKRCQREGSGIDGRLTAFLKTVDRFHQLAARVQSSRIDRQWRHEVGHRKVGSVRVCVDNERGVIRSEISRSARVVHLRQTHVRRHRAARAERFGDNRSVSRIVVVRFQTAVEAGSRCVARQHVVVRRAMAGIVVSEVSQQRESVGDFRKPRCVLTDLHPRHDRVDRFELAPKLGRGVRFQVERINGAQSALQKQDDQRNIVSRRIDPVLCGCVGREQLRKSDRTGQGTTQADSQSIPAGNPVAVVSVSVHGVSPARILSCDTDLVFRGSA